ncbi:DUF5412 family protein [Paenibacillus crassostreae]|uniref:Uncharacterized protein n=1 Tax=Paenibacillus crassostreae TaxID=1763538 RepID=A0A167DVT3_9BACL|nr:DUF5412 family protein [Paenibacillus crassostreae]AOZ91001.1 hypothetical protein LPB68_01475 [Paenibacillus crassostreae]OAB74836.1 hypothetical protein PNBC_12480 [Paenibacillus crassostreae]
MNGLYLNLFGLSILLLTVLIFIIFCLKLFFFFTRRKLFPKKLLFASLTGIIVVFALFAYSQYFFTFNNLEGEFYKGPVDSPNEKYTANAYYMTYGGAAGGVNVWVEITYNDELDKIETVYYSDAKSKFVMEWKDEDTLYIVNEEPKYPNSNRSIELEIGKEIYHENGLACQSLLMKDKYETCYQK